MRGMEKQPEPLPILDADFEVITGPIIGPPPKPKPWWARIYIQKMTFMGVPLNY